MNRRLSKFLLAIVSLSATAFIFLNTYEVVFNRDVVMANSITSFKAQDQINAIIKQYDLKTEAGRQKTNAEYKQLESLQIPALSSTLYLEEKRVIDGNWYVRPSMGHYTGLNKDDRGITVDYLIYARSGWQTFASPNQIEEGMDVRLFHDGHKLAAFRVAEKKELPPHTAFVASKSTNRQVLLIIEDPKNNVCYGYSLVLKDS